MGACASCLGLRRSSSSRDERAPLLNDGFHQYGIHGANANRQAYQPDPEDVRREREALDGICHAMSDNVIDVFTIQPPATGAMTPRPESAESIRDSFGDLTSEEMKLRTIKKGRGNPVFSTLERAGQGWRAVQDAIG